MTDQWTELDLDAVQPSQPAPAAAPAPLGGAATGVHYVGVAGTAGKTAVAYMVSATLTAAGFRCGCYLAGAQRILVDGAPAPAAAQDAARQALAAQPQSGLAAGLALACACFGAAGCAFAVVELPDPALAALLPNMPVCAITRLGADGTGRTPERIAAQAAQVLRKGCTAVTAPAQPKAALQELIVAAGKTGCALVVPDAEDLTARKARRLENRMDYGGYEALLPQLGRFAAENAAVAVEVALALWRKGYAIEDDAILAGMAAAPADCGVHLLRRRPYILAAPCRTPLQAEALAGLLAQEGFARVAAVAGLAASTDAEAFFAALETGFIPAEKRDEKTQLPGMSDNPIEKLYLVTPQGENALPAQTALAAAKFHFDAQVCPDLAAALAAARAGQPEAIVVLGSQSLCAAACAALEGKQK